MLKKFSVNSVPGTMNQQELRTFFGGKVLYSEDTISINNDSINFSQLTGVSYGYGDGYQYYDYSSISDWETEFYENLSDLKENNQEIVLFSQDSITYDNNTRWQININGSNILRDYIFFKMKERRVFKNVRSNEVYSNNINNAIYEYINYNIFSRYRLEKIDFYVSYYDIQAQTIYDSIQLQYSPKFNPNVYNKANLSNMSVVGYDPYKFDSIVIQYNQSKSSTQYGFDYYFDLTFTKI